jgi:Acyl-CoA carboxylase epsilon subunit
MTSSQAPSPAAAERQAAPERRADPVIRISGPATAEDIAALVAVLVAAASGADGADGAGGTSARASAWAAHRAAMRGPVGHGPTAWRTSLRP